MRHSVVQSELTLALEMGPVAKQMLQCPGGLPVWGAYRLDKATENSALFSLSEALSLADNPHSVC